MSHANLPLYEPLAQGSQASNIEDIRQQSNHIRKRALYHLLIKPMNDFFLSKSFWKIILDGNRADKINVYPINEIFEK